VSFCCSGAESWRARIKLPSSWKRRHGAAKRAWGRDEKGGIYMALGPVGKIHGGRHLRHGVGGNIVAVYWVIEIPLHAK
jgi:hypothetical protein